MTRSIRQMKGLRNININIELGHPERIRSTNPDTSDVLLDSLRWESLFATLQKLHILPLKTATCNISDKDIEKRWMLQSFYPYMEHAYRWTLEEKRARAKSLKEAILRTAKENGGSIIAETSAPETTETVSLCETAAMLRDVGKCER